jgi:iron(III) transport system substrate-binding protein
MVYPAEGTSYEVACMSIIRGARNMAQARRFYDWYLTPAAMDIGPRVNQFHVPAHPGAAPHPRIPDLSTIRLIDYDFATYGNPEVRRRILSRWDREIGSLPR